MKKDFDMYWFDQFQRKMIPPGEIEFAEIEYGRGLTSYIQRLEQIGLVNCENVLDAGGGIANWSSPAALLNEHVEIVDLSSTRLLTGYLMSKQMDIENVSFKHGSIEQLNFKNEQFDAIIC